MQTYAHAPTTDSTITDASRPDALRFALILVQLVGITVVVHLFRIESKAFSHLMTLTTAGFVVHYFLPLRHRLLFFLLLSLSGLVLVLGPVQAMWVVGIGLGLVGIAHLPRPIVERAVLLLAAGAALVLARTGRFDVPFSAAIWPIVGSMFMFRMIAYMYDLATGLGAASVSHSLSYFFLLPNVCFPLFPVVDFRTFVRTYYNAPRHGIYQVGLEWMIRGIVQLLLYRVVQLWVAISPYDVDNVFSLGQYFLSLYLLYLSISGQFHLIVGLLHLFGFNLPETHRSYYLASSFTDFWRRINIYWKDFMMKVFYYPIFFRLRRFGQTPALVLSIAAVFLITWALHAYQRFWILGFFHFSPNDSLFWAILGLLVIGNSLYEARYGRPRSLSKQAWEARGFGRLALKTAATFVAMCLLWSFWSSESIGSWLSLWPVALETPSRQQIGVLAILAAAGLIAMLAWGASSWWLSREPHAGARLRTVKTAGLILALLVLWVPKASAVLGAPGTVIASIRLPRLNQIQLEELERGYYEDLLAVDLFNRELGSLYTRRPPEWSKTLRDLGATRKDAELGSNLLPNLRVQFKGALFETNRWGLHDKEYSLTAAPGTFRIAVLGASNVMGWGVPRSATFEAVLEDRLNSEQSRSGPARYEILNFAFANMTAFEQIRLLDHKVMAFKPDSVWYIGHPYELKRIINRMRTSLQSADALWWQEHPWARELTRRAGVDERTPPYVAERHLAKFGDEILLNLFRGIVSYCEKRQVRPVYVHVPLSPNESRVQIDSTRYVELAKRAGFITLDLTGVFDGYGRESIWIAEWDAHPNALGHRLVADRLFELFQRDSRTILAGVESGVADAAQIESMTATGRPAAVRARH